MHLLGSRTKSAVGLLALGVVSFGVTASAVAAASAPSTASTPDTSTTATADPHTPPVEELEISGAVEVHSAEDIRFPIDAYRPDAEEENLILRAEHDAMKSCMARFGMTFDAPVWTVPAENHDYNRLFGVLNLAEARVYGYHMPGEVRHASGESPKSVDDQPSDSELDPRYMNVAMGDGPASAVNGQTVPEGGCITEARSTLGDDYAIQTLNEAAITYGLEQSDRDPRVTAAFRSWSACIGDFGLDYETPMEAINDPQWATPTASAAEIEVATADIQCKLSTNLTGLRVAVASAWQSQFIDLHVEEFAAATQGFATQLAKAKSASLSND